MRRRRKLARCVTGGRHWFTLYGRVGARSPVCVRSGCDVKNPRWSEERDRSFYELNRPNTLTLE